MGDTLGALSGLRKASRIGGTQMGIPTNPEARATWERNNPVTRGEMPGGPGKAGLKLVGTVDDMLKKLLGEMDQAAAPATRAAARASTAAHNAPRLPIGTPGAPPVRPPLPNTPQPSELYWQRTVNNASGESSASLEAINRLKEMAGKGQKFGVKNRGGQVRELIGADAVDGSMRLNPGEAFGIIENGIWRPY